MMRSLLWPTLGVAALLAGVAAYRLCVPANSGDGVAAVTPAFPIFDLALGDLEGRQQNFGQWRGKVLIVNYWATWCLPCREEMPGFSRLQDKHRDKGIQFVGISIDTPDKIVQFQKTTPVSYPLLIGDMAVMENSARLGNTRQALPFTAVFDRQGRLSATKLGRFSEPELEGHLLELISR